MNLVDFLYLLGGDCKCVTHVDVEIAKKKRLANVDKTVTVAKMENVNAVKVKTVAATKMVTAKNAVQMIANVIPRKVAAVVQIAPVAITMRGVNKAWMT